MDNSEYLFAALAATWLGLFGYFYYLGQRVRELRRDVRALESRHGDADPDTRR